MACNGVLTSPPSKSKPPCLKIFYLGGYFFFSKSNPPVFKLFTPPPTVELAHMAACKKHMFIFLKLLPVYKTTNIRLVAIGCQWLPIIY